METLTGVKGAALNIPNYDNGKAVMVTTDPFQWTRAPIQYKDVVLPV